MNVIEYYFYIMIYCFFLSSECECNIQGTIGGQCIYDKSEGCRCKEGFSGPFCSSCDFGYFGFPNCKRKCLFHSSAFFHSDTYIFFLNKKSIKISIKRGSFFFDAPCIYCFFLE